MSNEQDKQKHSERIHQKEVKIRRQIKIAGSYSLTKKVTKEPHRLHKMHAMNCGDPKCYMCGNPRKFFKERTIQEKRFDQQKFIDEVNDKEIFYEYVNEQDRQDILGAVYEQKYREGRVL